MLLATSCHFSFANTMTTLNTRTPPTSSRPFCPKCGLMWLKLGVGLHLVWLWSDHNHPGWVHQGIRRAKMFYIFQSSGWTYFGSTTIPPNWPVEYINMFCWGKGAEKKPIKQSGLFPNSTPTLYTDRKIRWSVYRVANERSFQACKLVSGDPETNSILISSFQRICLILTDVTISQVGFSLMLDAHLWMTPGQG